MLIGHAGAGAKLTEKACWNCWRLFEMLQQLVIASQLRFIRMLRLSGDATVSKAYWAGLACIIC